MTALAHTATTLVENCRAGQDTANLDEIYDPGCVSVEAVKMGEAPREVAGLEAIRGKHQWWYDNFEVHSSSVEGPFLHGDDKFAVIFEMDTTMKATGERTQMREVAIYTANQDGKIIREEFFYGNP